jgi:hypothetical protein
MPVLANERDVPATELIGHQLTLGRESHGRSDGFQVTRFGAHDFGHSLEIGQFPISPYKLVEAAGKVWFPECGNSRERSRSSAGIEG